MQRGRFSATVLLAVFLMGGLPISGCAKSNSRAIAVSIDDAVISTRVKTAFINDPVVGLARIDVETSSGVVTLSGRVKSREEEAKAIELARKITGVTDVKSTLVIQP